MLIIIKGYPLNPIPVGRSKLGLQFYCRFRNNCWFRLKLAVSLFISALLLNLKEYPINIWG
jgi:hypothetical protein